MGTKAKWLKGKLTFHNNAVVDGNVATQVGGGVAAKIQNYGMVVVSPTTIQSYYIDGGPAIGQKLDIVLGTSLVSSVFCSTAKNAVIIGATSTPMVNGIVFIPGATVPCSLQLRGLTTSRWVLTSHSTNKGGFSLTTAFA